MNKKPLNLSMTKDLKKEIKGQAVEEDLNANEYLVMTHRFYSYFKKEFTSNQELSFLEGLIKNIKASVRAELKG